MACCSHNHEECEVKEKNKSKIILYILSLVLFGIGFIPALAEYKIWIYLIAVLLAGYDLLIEGIKKLFKLNFEESTLMTIAIIGAFIKGDYPESCLVVLLFKLGEFLEEFAEARSNKNIEDITKIKANNANLVDGDNVNVVKVEDVKIGDILLVKPGEKIPVDGIVTSGTSQIDTSPITGESKPVKVEKNNEVISGSINLNSAIYIKAEKEYKDSMASQIIDLVYEATNNKGKTEKFITKFSKVYTPIVIVIAILLVIVPLILGADMDKWIDIALFFLVASCPCSLVISIPLSFFSCIGAISKKGMIIKGTKHIENLSKTDIIAFDKTGTLTTGKMVIDKLEATKIPENEMLEYIYSIESLSNHPIATAVANYKKDIEKLEVKDYIEYSGHGLYGVINGKEILFGNKKLMEKYDGIYIGNEEKKYIYLTFDEGYEAGYTEQILDVLKENDVKATFFITAHYLNTAEDLVKRMIDEGHIVGNHTVNHKSLPDISNEEIKDEVMKLHQAIYEKTGYEMKYIRPPKGEYSERTLAVTKELGYTNVMWTFGYLDYDENVQKGTEYAKKIVLDNLHNGEIMLLHGNSKDNANALDSIIKEAKAEGYEFKSLDEFER